MSPKIYRYIGKERDEETGLYYHGSRYYSPWLIVWLSPEPLGAVTEFNLYRCVQNNPLRIVDRTGLYPEDIMADSIVFGSGDAREMSRTYQQAAVGLVRAVGRIMGGFVELATGWDDTYYQQRRRDTHRESWSEFAGRINPISQIRQEISSIRESAHRQDTAATLEHLAMVGYSIGGTISLANSAARFLSRRVSAGRPTTRAAETTPQPQATMVARESLEAGAREEYSSRPPYGAPPPPVTPTLPITAMQTLQRLGFSPEQIQTFARGGLVIYNIATRGGHDTIAVLQMIGNRVRGGIFSINMRGTSTEAALQAFSVVRSQLRDVARAIGSTEYEMIGIAPNIRIRNWLDRMRFTHKVETVPEALGGPADVNVMTRVFPVR